MGLDINVCRLTKEPQEYYFSLCDEYGNYNNKNLPEWTKEYEQKVTEDWFDWDKYKEQTGIDINTMEVLQISYSGDNDIMTVYDKNTELPERNKYYEYEEALNKVTIKIDLNKVPTKSVEITVIYYEKIGYQRKGLNSNFYDDYQNGKIGYYVWTKAELERYKEEYCDNEASYYNGTAYSPKDNFQKYIIDNFTEGKDCVIFDW